MQQVTWTENRPLHPTTLKHINIPAFDAADTRRYLALGHAVPPAQRYVSEGPVKGTFGSLHCLPGENWRLGSWGAWCT